MRTALTWTLFALTLAWGAAILAAPRSLLPPSVTSFVYRAGHYMCHQRPERSFHVVGAADSGSTPYPVCARCTGLHLAAPLGLLALLLWHARDSSAGAARPMTSATGAAADPLRPWLLAIMVAATPTVASLLLEWIGGPTGMVSRCLAAMPLGATVAALSGAALLGLDPSERPSERV